MRALCILAVVACSQPETKSTPPPPPTVDAAPPAEKGHLVDGRYWMEAGAPDPLACQADADCANDTVTDATGCCIASPTPVPQTLAWHYWLSKRRQGPECKIECPPLPIPSAPATCETEARCRVGKCVNTCP